MNTIIDGVVVGSAGGSIAGLTVYLVQYIHNKIMNIVESKRIYTWLLENTSDERGDKHRSTCVIASWNNLTKDRVRYLCSVHESIYLSTTSTKDDMWGLKSRRRTKL